jgi:hypothetical protein
MVRLPQLRVHFVEVVLVHEDLAGLAASARRHRPFGLHHVHQARGTAETDSQPALQIRDGRLSALHDDAGRFVVELVVTHEDDPEEEIWFESVAALARRHDIPVVTPDNAKDPALAARIADVARSPEHRG